VGLLGSHIIDVGTWYMDDPIPESGVGLGGTLVWKEKREHYDTIESSFMFSKGFMMRFVSRLGNSAGEAHTQFRGTKGTFDTSTMKATGQGGDETDAIKEPVAVGDVKGHHTEHVQNWFNCIRSGQKTTADVHAGYAHSVISIMAHQAADQGRQVRYDPVKREIV
ncbi:MAG: Gfo/Idh/MocA family oxidoreductase, partial [bacterium]